MVVPLASECSFCSLASPGSSYATAKRNGRS
uniref:Uncharacterized protein n=1 Tax=Anopheles albimanus TaxID=7167 RepID=A0A182F5A9_ANOAL